MASKRKDAPRNESSLPPKASARGGAFSTAKTLPVAPEVSETSGKYGFEQVATASHILDEAPRTLRDFGGRQVLTNFTRLYLIAALPQSALST